MFSIVLRVALATLFNAGAVVSAFTGFALASVAALAALVLMATHAAAVPIDFTPAVDAIFDGLNLLIVALVGAGVTYALALIKRKTGIDLAIMQQGDNKMLHDGIQRGINALEDEARKRVMPDGSLRIDVESPVVAEMANRMIVMSPDLLKRMGVTEGRLKELVVEHMKATITNGAA